MRLLLLVAPQRQMPTLYLPLRSAFLLLLSASLACADGQGNILAVYGQAAAAKSPPPGWSFQWNATGKIGVAKGYAPLSYDGKSMSYGVLDEEGKARSDAPSHAISKDSRFLDVTTVRDKEGTARFYIASYTLGVEPAGEVWISNGNFRNKSFPDGTALEIYVNDELKSQSLFMKDRFAAVFQKNLGHLKKGDAIHVAIGPGGKSQKAGGRLYFSITEYPSGGAPPGPINILSPPIGGSNPQQGADAKIDPTYAAKHQRQCEAVSAANPELVFIGDSITARLPAELLEEKFGKFRPVNLGIGGDSIQNVLWRVQNGVLQNVHPKVIVLHIGANNASAGLTPEEIASGMPSLIAAILEKSPGSKILLLGILPHRGPLAEAYNNTIRQTNTRLAPLADNTRVFYLDVADAIVEPDGSIRSDIMPDNIHIAGPGFARWMDAMKPTLDKLLGE